MGFLTHIYEAEYYFPEDVQLEAVRAAIAEALENTPLYAHVTGDDEIQLLFQRSGEKHSVKYAYHGHEESNTDQTVFGTHKTKLWKFVDDLAFTFAIVEDSDGNQTPTVHTLSVSRVGKGDMFQNRKNIETIMNAVKQKIPYAQVRVFQK